MCFYFQFSFGVRVAQNAVFVSSPEQGSVVATSATDESYNSITVCIPFQLLHQLCARREWILAYHNRLGWVKRSARVDRHVRDTSCLAAEPAAEGGLLERVGNDTLACGKRKGKKKKSKKKGKQHW